MGLFDGITLDQINGQVLTNTKALLSIYQEILDLKGMIANIKASQNQPNEKTPVFCPNVSCNYNEDLPNVFKNYPKKYEGERLLLKIYSNMLSTDIITCVGSYDVENKKWIIFNFHFSSGICFKGIEMPLNENVYEVTDIYPLPYGF